MKAIIKRVLLPAGVSVGAAIGQRGRHVRAIGAAHRILCVVDTATNELTALFDRIVSRGSSSNRPTFAAAADTGSNQQKTYTVLRFVTRPECKVNADEYGKAFTQEVAGSPLHTDAIASEPSENGSSNSEFQQRTHSDVTMKQEDTTKPVESVARPRRATRHVFDIVVTSNLPAKHDHSQSTD